MSSGVMKPGSISGKSAAPGIEFARATEADIPYLLELRNLTMSEHLRTAGFTVDDQMQMARVQYRLDAASLLLADGEPAGVIKYFPEDGWINILQVQVHPDFQGKGIGGDAVRKVLSEASTTGTPVRLTVLKANPARRLYERLGFTCVGEDEYEFHMQWLPPRQGHD